MKLQAWIRSYACFGLYWWYKVTALPKAWIQPIRRDTSFKDYLAFKLAGHKIWPTFIHKKPVIQIFDVKMWNWFTGKFTCAWIYPNINPAALSAPRLSGSSPSGPPQAYQLCSWLCLLDPLSFFSPVLDSPPSPRLCRACSLDRWESAPSSSKDEYTDVSYTLNPTHLSITVSVQCEHVSTGPVTVKWADTLSSATGSLSWTGWHESSGRFVWGWLSPAG